MNFDKYRELAKNIEDDFISNGRTYKDVVDKITIDLFDEIEQDLTTQTSKSISKDSAMERQEGYYWVKLSENSTPVTAYFNGESWENYKGSERKFPTEWFFKVDKPENRLTPPNI